MVHRRRALLTLLVAVHLLYSAAIIVGDALNTRGFRTESDAARFRRLSVEPGRAYRDFDAEYPPLALATFKALRPGNFRGWAVRLVIVQALADAVIALALWWAAGIAALVRYLAFSAVILPFVLMKYDLLPTALAVIATALVVRRERIAGVLLGASVFTKVWTGALVCGFAARGRRTAFATATATIVAGGAAWCWWARGLGGIRQVLTFRGAKGWHAESGPGVLLELVTGKPLHGEAGAWRVGAPPAVLTAALGLAVVAAVIVVWLRVARAELSVPIGLPESAVVAAVLVFAPLLSPQFLVWLVPWIALAGAAGERGVERLGAFAIALTAMVVVLSEPKHVDTLWVQFVLLARNAALLGVFVTGMRRLRPGSLRDNESWPSPVPNPAASPTPLALTSSSTPRDG